MELFDAIRKRRSIRSFQPKAVEKEKLEQILESANQAPSAGDTQGYEIVVVEEGFHLDQIWKTLSDQTFTKPATLALVFCANEKRSAASYGTRG
jgi:nitroreductase